MSTTSCAKILRGSFGSAACQAALVKIHTTPSENASRGSHRHDAQMRRKRFFARHVSFIENFHGGDFFCFLNFRKLIFLRQRFVNRFLHFI